MLLFCAVGGTGRVIVLQNTVTVTVKTYFSIVELSIPVFTVASSSLIQKDVVLLFIPSREYVEMSFFSTCQDDN